MALHKKNLFLFSALLLIFFFSFPAATDCAEKPGKAGKASTPQLAVGSVDMAVLYAFHPLMRYYSFETELFIRPFKEGIEKSEYVKAILERRENYQKMRESSEAEIIKLQYEISLIVADTNVLLTAVNSEQVLLNRAYSEEFDKLRSEAEKNACASRHRKDLANVEMKYYEDKKKFDERKAEANAKISELADKIDEVHYVDKKDNQKIFDIIMAEIDQAIKEVAEEKKMSLVLNSTFVSVFTPPENIKPEDLELKKLTAPAGNNILPEANYDNLIEKTERKDAEKKVNENEYKALYKKRAEYIQLFARNEVPSRANQMIAYGGEDITIDVLVKILKIHLVPQEKITSITDAIRETSMGRVKKEF